MWSSFKAGFAVALGGLAAWALADRVSKIIADENLADKAEKFVDDWKESRKVSRVEREKRERHDDYDARH